MQSDARLHTEDIRPLLRLMVNVAALKPDGILQRQFLIDGLKSLFKAKLGWFAVVDN